LGAIGGLANERRKEMTEKEEAVGYYTADGDIYCVECINKDIEIMKEIDRAITAEDLEGNSYVCKGCKDEIK
jgi:hypothetical protein